MERRIQFILFVACILLIPFADGHITVQIGSAVSALLIHINRITDILMERLDDLEDKLDDL